MITYKQYLEDIILWLQNNDLYNADTLSWCLGVAYERWSKGLVLFSQEKNLE